MRTAILCAALIVAFFAPIMFVECRNIVFLALVIMVFRLLMVLTNAEAKLAN